MVKPVPIISSICQAAFFVAVWFPVVGLYKYNTSFQPHIDPDPRIVWQIRSQYLTEFVVLLVGGLLGAFLAWIALRKTNDRPQWFLRLSAVFGSLWLIVFPIGTAVGYCMLRWRRPRIRGAH